MCHLDTGQNFVRQFGAAADDGDLMFVSSPRKTRIAAPSIGVNLRANSYGVLDEGNEVVPGHVHDALEVDAAMPLPLFSTVTVAGCENTRFVGAQ